MACSSDEKPIEIEEEGSIIGKWQLFERCSYNFNSDDSCREIEPERKHFFYFKEDKSVNTNLYIEGCNNGIYVFSQDSIYMEFECIDFTVPVNKLSETEFHFKLPEMMEGQSINI